MFLLRVFIELFALLHLSQLFFQVSQVLFLNVFKGPSDFQSQILSEVPLCVDDMDDVVLTECKFVP